MNNFYVYIHYRNDTDEPFYVGKGRGKRTFVKGKSTRNSYWINIVNKADYTVKLFEENLTEEQAFELECKIIEELRMYGYRLANLTDGGEGGSRFAPPPETRAKMRKAAIGNKHSCGYNHTTEFREGVRKRLTGNKYKLGIPSHLRKAVICIESGEIFPSASHASIFLGYNERTVSNAIKRGTKCKGLTFSYTTQPAKENN